MPVVSFLLHSTFFFMYILKEMPQCNKRAKGKAEKNLSPLFTDVAGFHISYQHSGHHLHAFIQFFFFSKLTVKGFRILTYSNYILKWWPDNRKWDISSSTANYWQICRLWIIWITFQASYWWYRMHADTYCCLQCMSLKQHNCLNKLCRNILNSKAFY